MCVYVVDGGSQVRDGKHAHVVSSALQTTILFKGSLFLIWMFIFPTSCLYLCLVCLCHILDPSFLRDLQHFLLATTPSTV